MAEVPVNIHGQSVCDHNEGRISYPFTWEDKNGSSTGAGVTVANFDCEGLRAGECCLMIHEYGKALTRSGYDVNGQCLACFVHQEPLVPIANDQSNGATYYFDYIYTTNDDEEEDSKQCVQEQLTGDAIDFLDGETAVKVDTTIAPLKQSREDQDCDNFPQLPFELYDAALLIHPLSHQIGVFACSVCYGKQDNNLDLAVFEYPISQISNLLKRDPPSSKENCIII
jgi:hypothetical protein